MRRKTKIVLAITFMVAVLVLTFSYIYISELLRQRVTTARESAAQLTSNLAYLAANAAPDLSSTKVDTANPQATRRAVAYYLGTDRDLNNFLESVVGTWPIIYDAAIVDSDGKAILHTNPDLVGKTVPDRPDFHQVENANFRRQFRMVYNPPTVYDVRIPLQLDGARFGSIRVGVSTVFPEERTDPALAAGHRVFQHRDSHLADPGRRAFEHCPGAAGTDQSQPGQCYRRQRRGSQRT